MAASLKDIVSAIAPTIPANLIAPPSLAAISTVAQNFPIALGTTLGFECPLSLPVPIAEANADFFFRVSGIWGQSLLAGQLRSPPILEQLQPQVDLCPSPFTQLWDSAPWKQIRCFAQQWAQPSSLLHRAIEDIWLEFDLPQARSGCPLPSSFFGLKSPGLPCFDWISQTALPLLCDDGLSPQITATLHQCFAAIPASARVFQIGALLGRCSSAAASPPLRLYIQNLALAQLPPLLQRLNWSGDVDLLMQMLSRVCLGQKLCALQLQIQETLSPVIAIECAFPNRAVWQQVLNRLVMAGFCAPERSQALLDYPGYVRARDNVAPFPQVLADWSTQLSPYRECLLVKRLAYLKFTYQPGHPLLVKAYLGVSPTWVDPRYLEPDGAIAAPTPHQESVAIQLCKGLIQQLDYGEVDVDDLFIYQRSQKSRWLNQALETMCVGG